MYAQKQNETWVELPFGSPVTHNGFQASYGTIEIWNEAERNAFGIYTVSETPNTPEGKIAIPGGITDIDGKPVREYTYANAPVFEDTSKFIPPSILRQRAQKIGIWEDLAAYLIQYPHLMLMVLTLERGIDPKYPELLTGFASLQVPQSAQDYLLSDPMLGV